MKNNIDIIIYKINLWWNFKFKLKLIKADNYIKTYTFLNLLKHIFAFGNHII